MRKLLFLTLCSLFLAQNAFAWNWWWRPPPPPKPTVSIAAVKEQADQNTAKIVENKGKIADNKGRIDLNLSMLSTQATSLAGTLSLAKTNQTTIADHEDRITSNTSRITTLEGAQNPQAQVKYPTYANGELIGESSVTFSEGINTYEEILVMLTTNPDFYPVRLHRSGLIDDTISPMLEYTQPDCSNDALVMIKTANPYKYFFFGLPKGVIFPFGNDVYYIPKNPVFYNDIYIYSYRHPGNSTVCVNQSPIHRDYTTHYAKPLLNDTNITGLGIYPFPTPITFDGIQEPEHVGVP